MTWAFLNVEALVLYKNKVFLRNFVPLKYLMGLSGTPLKSVHTVIQQGP